MKAKTEQTRVYWLKTFAGSKKRTLGIVMVAGADAPPEIRGQRIFYRLLRWTEDLRMRRDHSVGFSKAAFEAAKQDGVQYIVTHSEENKEMIIAHVNAFTFERNYGQGLQKRAPLDKTLTLLSVRQLSYPRAIGERWVKDEDPSSGAPPVTQPSLF